jgi:hypothetical protein
MRISEPKLRIGYGTGGEVVACLTCLERGVAELEATAYREWNSEPKQQLPPMPPIPPLPRPWPERERLPGREVPLPPRSLDALLGGQKLQGKKTLLGIAAYVAVAACQTLGLLPIGGEVYELLSTVALGYAGLGMAAKIERRAGDATPNYAG